MPSRQDTLALGRVRTLRSENKPMFRRLCLDGLLRRGVKAVCKDA